MLSFPGTYTTLRSNLANVACHRALLAAGPEGVKEGPYQDRPLLCSFRL